MAPIKIAFCALLAGLTVLWLLADTFVPQPFGYFPLRHVLVQYTGVIAMGAMSVAVVLAARPKAIEPALGGLDKMYRLHKWLGIAALAFGVVHWLWAKGTKWAVGWGWLTRPARRGGGQALGALEQLFRGQRDLAEFLGEWTFYAAAVLIVLALVRRFPYRLFAKTHTILAALYLVLVFHTIILLEFRYWLQPVGIVMALMTAAGTVAAVRVLSRQVGAHRKVTGHIESLTYYPELRVLETTLVMEPGWPGQQPGQFAFLTSDRNEGAHPYTIASAWDPRERRITVFTKALGDHTSRLSERLKAGDAVTVEGPYGCFTFTDQCKRQIWVGGGIGITPFIARMKHLARARDQQHAIDLFHPTADFSPSAIDNLQADAQAAHVRLHLLVDARDGRLNGERLRNTVPDWREASIWFCGPAALGKALRRDLAAHGMDPGNFHQELFQMR
ncbi:ferredoxin reductase family protein [Cupriavidus basilensis]|uniref:ferredoxin reductase family protein n=1 Tax=Cupriavidus basilensis TaxID=68895 RepID=UPI0007512D74|nr:ferric reductase-like transmembrane domain-containing protein [Cupriavidus basilensis]